MEFSKQWILPKDAFKMAGLEMPDFVSFNPDLKRWKGKKVGQYDIVRTVRHDGTGLFVKQLFLDALFLISARASCYVGQDGETGLRHYEIGEISIASVFGRYEINGKTIFGQRQRIRVPVRCYYVSA